MITVYSSLARSKVPLNPVVPGQVSIYVCGVTPYDKAHIGHARPAVIWDAFKRHLMRRGYVVRHVQNFTDIDDKLVRRAAELKMPMAQLAERHMGEYLTALRQLEVLPPDFFPRVTDNIPAIIAFIDVLVSKGFAYESQGDVYFAVERVPDYGKLSGRSTEELLAGARIAPKESKRSPHDFALWKKTVADEPGWDSPWGRGRPGWHIECSVMAFAYLGERFDLHGGGMDLIFPHHENEIAQSEAYFQHPSASIWMHNGLVTQQSVKMSKSLGNGVDLEALLARFDPLVVRTFLLSVHYRTPLAFSEEELGNWSRAIGRLRALWDEVGDCPPPSRWVEDADLRTLWDFESRLLSCLDDDLNTARAFAEVFDMARLVRRVMAEGGESARIAGFMGRQNLFKADGILRFLPTIPAAVRSRPATDEALVHEILEIRERARNEKAYGWADAIRLALGRARWEIEDTPDGPRAHYLPKEDPH